MNLIKNKLRSKTGASLLFALLFMLFCVLIGGTVLAASSANGYRINRTNNKQAEQGERSAAKLVSDELDMGSTSFIVTIETKIVTTGSNVEKTSTVRIPEGVKMTPLQRLTVEMAVWKYIKENGDLGTLTLSNFVYSDGTTNQTITKMDSFWFQYNLNSTAPFAATVQLSGANLVNRSANLSFQKGTGNYDLTVDFGEDSHYSIQMKAKFTPGETVSTPYGQGTLETKTTTIYWENPIIKKEGT